MTSTVASVTVLAALCVVASAFLPEYLKKVSGIVDTCTKTYGTTQADVFKLLDTHKVPDTHEMKCTIDCYLAHIGYLKDGEIQWDYSKAQHKEKYADDPESLEKSDQILDICRKQVKIDGKKECEISEILLTCMFDQAEKLGLKTDFSKAKQA